MENEEINLECTDETITCSVNPLEIHKDEKTVDSQPQEQEEQKIQEELNNNDETNKDEVINSNNNEELINIKSDEKEENIQSINEQDSEVLKNNFEENKEEVKEEVKIVECIKDKSMSEGKEIDDKEMDEGQNEIENKNNEEMNEQIQQVYRYTPDSLLKIRNSPLVKKPPKCINNSDCKYTAFWKNSTNQPFENKTNGYFFQSNNPGYIGSGRTLHRNNVMWNSKNLKNQKTQRHVHFYQDYFKENQYNFNNNNNNDKYYYQKYLPVSRYDEPIFYDKYSTSSYNGVRKSMKYPTYFHNSNNNGNKNNEESEPEWMNHGPISQSDVIELKGFDDPNKNDSTFTINTNLSVVENQDGHTTARSSTPTKRNDSNNNEKFEQLDNGLQKSEIQLKNTNRDFNFEEFLKSDSFAGLLSAEEIQMKSSKSSRFSQWFKNDNKIDHHKLNKMDNSRLILDELNNIINDDANHIKSFQTSNKFQSVGEVEAHLLQPGFMGGRSDFKKSYYNNNQTHNKEDAEKFKNLMSKISDNQSNNYLNSHYKKPHVSDVTGNYLLQLLNRQQQQQQQQKIKQIISMLFLYQSQLQQQQLVLKGYNRVQNNGTNSADFFKAFLQYGQKFPSNNHDNNHISGTRAIKKRDSFVQYAPNIEQQQMHQFQQYQSNNYKGNNNMHGIRNHNYHLYEKNQHKNFQQSYPSLKSIPLPTPPNEIAANQKHL